MHRRALHRVGRDVGQLLGLERLGRLLLAHGCRHLLALGLLLRRLPDVVVEVEVIGELAHLRCRGLRRRGLLLLLLALLLLLLLALLLALLALAAAARRRQRWQRRHRRTRRRHVSCAPRCDARCELGMQLHTRLAPDAAKGIDGGLAPLRRRIRVCPRLEQQQRHLTQAHMGLQPPKHRAAASKT